jgi:H+/Cl- antiporter ClcA
VSDPEAAHGAAPALPKETRLGDFSTNKRLLLITPMAGLIGVISALVAYALVWLIGLITNLAYYHRLSTKLVSPADNQLGLAAVLVPMAGGLIIGLMARYGSEKIRGHGIPEAMEAILTLLVAGAAAGMAAIFATPLAAVLLAVELLLFEWKPRSFIPVAAAAAVAAALRVPLLGPGPIFPLPGHASLSWQELTFSLGVGLLAGFGSGVLTWLVYTADDVFAKLPIHFMWWPLIGGLFVGLGGLVFPRALGVGYDTIGDLLAGHLVGGFLIGLMLTKALIWAIALGSGTSGGVLAPLLIMGGALGALEPVGSRSAMWDSGP